MRLLRWTIPVCVLLSAVLCSFAATSTYDGTERGFWDNRAVIVAEVSAVDPKERLMDVMVRAVVMTDAMIMPQLDVKYYLRASSSHAGLSPEVGDLYFMCLFIRDGQWNLDDSYLTFMPSRNGIEKLESMKDPKLYELLKKIDEVRREYVRKNEQRKKRN